jgi:hypothetical protein
MEYTANLIPTMTSDTTPSGVASASSVLFGFYSAFRAFDKVLTMPNIWHSDSTGQPYWLQYQFDSVQTIAKYTLTSRDDVNSNMPQDWTFEGSNDGSNWTVLDTQTGQTWTTSETKIFTFVNTTAYLYYRIYVTLTDSTYCNVVEMEMMAALTPSVDITTSLKTEVASDTDISFELSHCLSIVANLFKNIELFEDILLLLVKTFTFQNNIDLSLNKNTVVSSPINLSLKRTIHPQRSIYTDLLSSKLFSLDILFNLMKTVECYTDISLWFAVNYEAFNDITTCIRKHWTGTGAVSAVLSKEDVFDFTSDIRWKLERDTDVGFSLVNAATTAPAGLDAVDIYINGTLLTDVDNRTISWEWTANDSPGTCEFQVARNFDNYNTTLAGVNFPLSIGDTIEIYFSGIKKYHGEITGFDTAASEKTVVRGLDRKYKVNAYLSIYDYGRHAIFNPDDDVNLYQSTGAMLGYLLDDLVSKGVITGYTGLFNGVVVEQTEAEGTPYGKLITQLLDQSGTYKWNITPDGVLAIYERGGGSIKELPYQKSNTQLGLYDIIDCRFAVNNKSELITTAEVILGTESTESYLTYGRRLIREYVIRDWAYADEKPGLNSAAGVDSDEDEDPAAFLGFAKTESYSDIFQRYKIPSWKKGDILDEKYKPNITTTFPILSKTVAKAYSWDGTNLVKTETYSTLRWHQVRFCPYGFSIHSDEEGGYIRFSTPQVIIQKKQFVMRQGSWEVSDVMQYYALDHYLQCQVWRPTEHLLSEYPTIFDVVYVGNSGAGQKRRLSFTQLGISPGYTWEEIRNGEKLIHYVPPYNDTPYAIDRAKYFLASTNDAQTDGTVAITLDAQDYFGLNLGNRINIGNTLEANIYTNNNGFPLDVESMLFNVGSYMCTLQLAHKRKHICSEDLPERSTEANILRIVVHEA